jgi:hypothetical protein
MPNKPPLVVICDSLFFRKFNFLSAISSQSRQEGENRFYFSAFPAIEADFAFLISTVFCRFFASRAAISPERARAPAIVRQSESKISAINNHKIRISLAFMLMKPRRAP